LEQGAYAHAMNDEFKLDLGPLRRALLSLEEGLEKKV